jgi:hypothetical protein
MNGESMRPQREIYCPLVPFDQDISKMSPTDLRAHAAAYPNAEYPPARWAGDGMDGLKLADGTPFGPPEQDDLDALLALDGGESRGISNKTVVDLGALVQAFEGRCLARLGEDARRWPALGVLRCPIKKCNIEGAILRADLRILCCVFLGASKIAFTRLEQGVNLLGSLFAERVNFSGAHFQEKAHFPATTFLGGVRFYEARFDGDTRFNETVFNGSLCLEHTRFAEALDLSKAILRGVTWIDIKGIRVSGRTSLSGDLKIDFEEIQGRILGEFGERLSAPDDGTPSASRRERTESLLYAADQYSTLAGNFAASTGPSSWRASDYCHSRYLDLYRRISWLRGHYWPWAKSLFFKLVLGNGIWVKYPFLSAACVILGFGLMYGLALDHLIRSDSCVLPPADGAAAVTPPNGQGVACLADIGPWYARGLTAVYYSVITFATVGYGDWHPVGWARFFAAAEALCGVTLMSAFTVVLVRKIIR